MSDGETLEAKLNRITREYYQQLERGGDASPDAFIEKYPEFQSELEEFFSDLNVLRDVRPSPTTNPVRTTQQTNHRTRWLLHNFPSARVGKYQLLEEIGRGGMGVVFRARHEDLDRVVALKMILSGPLASYSEIRRFGKEARSAAALTHPNIVRVYEVDQDQGYRFYTMDYIEGVSLAGYLRNGSLAPREAAALVVKTALAVHYAHQNGVLHRDLKPANVLLDQGRVPHVSDFGLAKSMSDPRFDIGTGLTETGQILGTASYMSPEQAEAKSDLTSVKSDVYSLGAILYECLCGRAPFVAESTVETLRQVIHEDPVPARVLNPRVPRDIETICLKALAKEPSRRYENAQAFADDLERFLDGRQVIARPIGKLVRLQRWAFRNPSTAALGVVMSLFAVLLPTAAFTYAVYAENQSSIQHSLRVRADQEAQAANDARRKLELALDSERIALAESKASLHQANWNAYRASIYPMTDAWKKREFGWLHEQLRKSEQLYPPEFVGWEWLFLYQTVKQEFTFHRFEKENYVFLRCDGTHAYVAMRRENGAIDIRDSSSLELLRTIPGSSQRYLDWHPTKPHLAAANDKNELQIWDVTNGRLIESFATKNDETISNQRGVAWHPDGSKLALGGSRRVDVFDLEAGTVERIGCKSMASKLDWNPKSDLLAVGGAGHLQVIDTESEKEVWYHSRTRVYFGQTIWINGGNRVAAAWGYPDYSVRIYDLKGNIQNSLQIGHEPDELWWDAVARELIVAGKDMKVHWWRVDEDGPYRTESTHGNLIKSMEVMPSTLDAISVDGSGGVRQFSTISRNLHQLEMTINGGNSRIWACEWHPQLENLVAIESNQFTQIIDVNVGSVAARYRNPKRGLSTAWHPSRPEIAVLHQDGTILIYDVPGEEPTQTLQASSERFHVTLEWDSKGERLLVGTGQTASKGCDFAFEIIHVASGEKDLYRRFGSRSVAQFSPDDRTVAVHSKEHGEKRIRFIDVEANRLEVESNILTKFYEQMEFHPDGEVLAIGGDGGILLIVDVTTGKYLREGNAHDASIRSLHWSPDGNRLLTTSDDGVMKLWSGEDYQLVATFENMGAASDWSPDGTKIATCSPDGHFRVFSSVDWEPQWPCITKTATRIEGEDLRRISKPSGGYWAQDMTRFKAARWSNDQQFVWINGSARDRCTLGFQVEISGVYDMSAGFTTACDYGKFDIYVDRELIAESIDFYRPGDISTVNNFEKELGRIELESGKHTLQVLRRGRHVDAQPFYGFGLDYIELIMTEDSTE